jgi:hypothetical protein
LYAKGRMPSAVRWVYKEQFWTLQPLHEKGIGESVWIFPYSGYERQINDGFAFTWL